MHGCKRLECQHKDGGTRPMNTVSGRQSEMVKSGVTDSRACIAANRSLSWFNTSPVIDSEEGVGNKSDHLSMTYRIVIG